MRPVLASIALVLAAAALTACGGNDYLSTEELMKPETCMECHQTHYTEWSGSMHAYASDDPVFLAMNKRGQADTGGTLGSFCVNCHAPLAVKLGMTTDGLDLDQVPQWAKGITCFYCHSIDQVTDDHNNAILLADDDVMRGGISNPADTPAHRSAESPMLDSKATESSAACGSCHDVVTPAGVNLERTFSEWQATIFGQDNPLTHLSCSTCHMFATDGVVTSGPGAAGLDVPLRPYGVHEHTFAGIDQALTTWPETDVQAAKIHRDLDPAIQVRMCLTPVNGDQIELTLDNRGAGHKWPSGAAQDRRAWVELIAYDDQDTVLFSSGVVPDGTDADELAASGTDPYLWQINDQVFDSSDQPADFFWQVARYDETNTLKGPITSDPGNPAYVHSTTRDFPVPGLRATIAKITIRVRIRALPTAMLDDLVSGGELDASIPDKVQTLDIAGTDVEWDASSGNNCLQ
jgi:Cytochrome c554 and c-prime